MSEEFYPEHEIHTDPVENQQTEQPGASQQNQALQPGRRRVKGQIVRLPQTYALFQLHHFFLAKFPDGHGTRPLSPHSMRQLRHLSKKQWKPPAGLWYTEEDPHKKKRRRLSCIKALYWIWAA